MVLPSCTKHRTLSYYVVLTPRGMKFSGHRKRLAKQIGCLTFGLLRLLLHSLLPFFVFPTVLCLISGFRRFAAVFLFFFEDFLAGLLAVFSVDFLAVFFGGSLAIRVGAFVRRGIITNGGITASPIKPAAAIGITTTSSPGFIGSGSIALCAASAATAAMSFTTSSVLTQ